MVKKKNNIKKNNGAKKKKKTQNKEKMQKSVFLYGNPNKEKLSILKEQQTDYINAINYYIDFLYNTDNYDVDVFLSILNNTTKSPLLRQIEKDLRKNTNLKSALSQAAFDEAVNKVSNQFVEIKNQMYTFDKQNPFVSSTVLFAMSVYHYSRTEMYDRIHQLKSNKEKELIELQTTITQELEEKELEKKKRKVKNLQKNIQFYKSLLLLLSVLFHSEFKFIMTEFDLWYCVISDSFKQPYCKKTSVRLTNKAYIFEKSKRVKSPYVIEITNSKSNKRVQIPLKTSTVGLKRLEKYDVGTTIMYTIRDDGTLKITIPIEKTIKIETKNTIEEYIGVDTGVSDSFHTSTDIAIGSGYPIEFFYKNEVEPAFAEINKLKIKKKKLKDYLHKHKDELTDIQIKQHITKIDHIEQNIRQNKKAKKLLNRYHNLNEQLINQVCNEYIKLLNNNKSIMTVLELLDVKEFNKSKSDNSMHSLFIRGKLQKRLMEKLNWNGYQFMEVEPSFTSQTCPVCGHVHKKNRNNKTFECLCCGYKDDADHVGAMNIKSRATDEEIQILCEEYKYNKRECLKQLKILLEKRHTEYLNEHEELKKKVEEKEVSKNKKKQNTITQNKSND